MLTSSTGNLSNLGLAFSLSPNNFRNRIRAALLNGYSLLSNFQPSN